ncbi:MAG TPA: hypothetical protein VHC45_14995 [Gaiellaceae bacterium]|nr:hypothetical protein [Gaiellaceae bacterium]
MALLLVKLLLTPAIVVSTTLAGRRLGPAVSGWLVALPLVSGPLTYFFALEHGQRFAAHASVGSLSGTLGEVGFCVGWARTARSGAWWRPLVAASASFAAVGLVVEALPLDERLPSPLLPLALACLAGLLVGLRVVPRLAPAASDAVPVPRWDLPARTVVATGILLALTTLAEVLGARLSGLLAVYPLYTVVLASFAQRHEGPAAAMRLLRGLLLGLFAFLAFYAVLAGLLTRVGTGVAFAVAAVVCLTVHGASLWPLHRERSRRVAPAPA